MKLPAWQVCVAAAALAMMPCLALGETSRELWESLGHSGDWPRPEREQSLDFHRQALAIAERESGVDPGNAQWQHAVWLSSGRVGRFLMEFDRHEEALAVFRRGLTAASHLAKAEPGRSEWQRAVAASQLKIGEALVDLGRAREGLQAFREALSIAEKLAEASSNASDRREVMTAHNQIGWVLFAQGDFSAALGAHRAAKAIAADRATAGERIGQEDLAVSDEAVGTTLAMLGNFDAALEVFQESQAIRERLLAEKPDVFRVYELSKTWELVGKTRLRQGALDKSLAAFESSLDLRKAAIALQPENPFWEIAASNSYGHVGTVLALLGRRPEARESFQKGRAILLRYNDDTGWFDTQLLQLE